MKAWPPTERVEIPGHLDSAESLQAPRLSPAPQLEKGPAPPPPTPAHPRCLKRKLRGPLLAVAASPRYRRHVRFCVFPTGGAILMHLLTVCVGVFCLHKCHIYMCGWSPWRSEERRITQAALYVARA
ncbi:uncharacterized protein LOC666105 [Mus musculus]|uniref:Uncharacterized protein n=1 Tax=Mus musculus TaxID=10090 RepID=Q3UTG5_MOUSE|nr:uncharacterized protein LOC666105 [Mus musculus]BAE24015.1 unnamed protein product [Mus musculus]